MITPSFPSFCFYFFLFFFLSSFLPFSSRTRDSTPYRVGRSVGWSVRWSVCPVTFLNAQQFLHYCSCPTVHDCINVYLALFYSIYHILFFLYPKIVFSLQVFVFISLFSCLIPWNFFLYLFFLRLQFILSFSFHPKNVAIQIQLETLFYLIITFLFH